jgi:hypothetical protein
MSDATTFDSSSPAPWDAKPEPEPDNKPQDVKAPGEVIPSEPPEEPVHGLSYKLGLLEGAIEVAIRKLEQSDEEAIADGLSAVLKRVKDM